MIPTTELQLSKMPWEPAPPAVASPTLALSQSSNLDRQLLDHGMSITRHGHLELAVEETSFVSGLPPETVDLLRHSIIEPQREAVARGVGSPVTLASLLLQSGDVEGARAALGKVDHADYWSSHLLAVCYWHSGDKSEAVSILRGLADRDPDDPRPLHALGKLLPTLGRLDEAIGALRAASLLDEESPAILNDLAAVLIMKQEHKDALRVLRAATAISPTYAAALANTGVAHALLGHRAKATDFFRRALVVDRHCVSAIHNLAEALLDARAWESVVDLLRPYIDRAPQDARAHELLAWAYMSTDRWRDAQRTLQSGLSLRNERDPSLLNNLALVFAKTTQLDRAEIAFQRGIEIAPDNSLIRANYAHFLASHRRWKEVCRVLRPQDIDDNSDRAALLASALFRTSAYEDGVDFLRSILPKFPELRFYQMLGNCLASNLDRPKDAIEVYREALNKFTDGDHLLINNLAYALIATGELNEARSILTSIVTEHRNKSDITSLCVVASYGLLNIRLGDFDGGIAFYREAFHRGGAMRPRIKQKMEVEEGRYLLESGEISRAQKLLKSAHGGPDAEFVRQAEKLLATIYN